MVEPKRKKKRKRAVYASTPEISKAFDPMAAMALNKLTPERKIVLKGILVETFLSAYKTKKSRYKEDVLKLQKEWGV